MNPNESNRPSRTEVADYFRALQDEICRALMNASGGADVFAEDLWTRPGGGGGRTRVLEEGTLFEKAGVNFSEVAGDFPADFAATMPGSGTAFYATGMSLVLHPRSPMVPTVHANFRYLERGPACWFGGGADLTPYYLFEEDCRHFHGTWKPICEAHEPGSYAKHKSECDRYFYLPHRKETRGIGGIFFDYLQDDPGKRFGFIKDCGSAFTQAYLPIAQRRAKMEYGEAERSWQLFRRGRYVEFNLIYDRGTVFGLKTGGRTESILMSLPPLVTWSYNRQPTPGSREAELVAVLEQPREWT